MADELIAPDPNVGAVTVRYWAAARAAAGIETEQVETGNLAEVLNEIGRRHRDRDRFARVIDSCSILVGETPVGAREPSDVVLRVGDTIEFLPPFAGG